MREEEESDTSADVSGAVMLALSFLSSVENGDSSAVFGCPSSDFKLL